MQCGFVCDDAASSDSQSLLHSPFALTELQSCVAWQHCTGLTPGHCITHVCLTHMYLHGMPNKLLCSVLWPEVRCIKGRGDTYCMSAGCSEDYLGPMLSGAEFMAPETVRALQGCPEPDEPAVSPAADIFSLGALLKALMLVGLSHHCAPICSST